MKNEMTRYMLKKHLKKNMLIGTCIAGTICLMFFIIALVVRDGMHSDMHNFSTAVLFLWGVFAATINLSTEGIQMSICMNRSRKSAVKAIFLTIILNIAFYSALALVTEAAIAGFSKAFDFSYIFKPMIKVAGLSGAGNGFTGILMAWCYNMLICCLVAVSLLLFISLTLNIGKYAWAAIWIIYMIVVTSAEDLFKLVSKFLRRTIGYTAVSVLCAMLILSVVLSVIAFITLKRTQLKKNALMWNRSGRSV